MFLAASGNREAKPKPHGTLNPKPHRTGRCFLIYGTTRQPICGYRTGIVCYIASVAPDILSRIKQKRYSAREEWKAVLHTLSLAGLELCCERPLRPRDSTEQETREWQGERPLLCHPTSGETEWDVLQALEKKKLDMREVFVGGFYVAEHEGMQGQKLAISQCRPDACRRPIMLSRRSTSGPK